MNNLHTIIFSLFSFILLSNVVHSQEVIDYKGLTVEEKTEIDGKLELIEKAFKTSKPELLKKHLAPNFTAAGHSMPIAYKQVLPQMCEKLPKGDFEINKISNPSEELFSIDLDITPYNIPLIVKLNNHFLILSINVVNEQQDKNQIDKPDNYLIEQEHIILPFSIVDGYIFVDGQVGEISGKFMFDTGNPFGIFLNNNYIKLDTTNFFKAGNAGSGQALKLYKSPIEKINVANQFKLEELSSVVHADFEFIEQGITPDFLGLIGFELLKHYEFVIDYNLKEIHLYLLDEKGNSSMTQITDENIIVTLNFTTTSSEQIPTVEIISSGQKINLRFDTGTLGSLQLTPKSANKLRKDGNLVEGKNNPRTKEEEYTGNYFTLRGVNYGITSIGDINNLSFSEGKNNELMCGYNFLKNYLSVWNYKKKTLTLIKQ
jgi:hypothetical protein